MRWRKLGRVFRSDGQRDWMHSHSAMPMALVLPDRVRIYFGVRDSRNRPHIGYLDFDPEQPTEISALAEKPVLAPGPWGHFDDNGLYPGSLVEDGNQLRLYYMGRSNGEPPLYYMSIGLAVGPLDGSSFQRYSMAPVLGRSDADPWMTSTPWVMRLGRDDWRMWYMSGIGWESLADKVSLYHIKTASSTDGFSWQPSETVAIPLASDETNVAAPTVWRESAVFHMLYCRVRRNAGSYKLGYASSDDGVTWHRQDELVGIGASEHGWDSECMAYPSVFRYRGKQFLLYAGNGLGREGIGLAVREA